MMTRDNFLTDQRTGESRFRVRRMLAAGRSYQIVLAEDTANDDRPVCVRAVLYDTDRLDDQEYRQGRQDALEREKAFLEAVDSPLLPEPLALFRASNEEAGFADEPVLVYEYIEGQTLFEWVEQAHPEGVEPGRALGIFRHLVRFFISVHDAGYVFRDLDPRHFIVDGEGALEGVVGFGNATLKGERPNAHKMEYDKAVYVAPEARAERSGKLLRPAADSYALGALLSFLLTGEEPREVVENPLSWQAYDRLTNLEPPGLALLVARLIQPLAKKRFGRLEKLLPYTTEEGLPTAQTQGFGMLLLPAPFSGVEDPKNNRALKSKLSSGPLISVDEKKKMDEQSSREEDREKEGRTNEGMPPTWMVGAMLLALLSVATLFVLGVI